MTPPRDRFLRDDEENNLRSVLHRLTQHDHRMMTRLARREAPWPIDRFFRIVTHMGGATATIGTGVVLLLIPSTRSLGLAVGSAILSSHLVIQVLKRLIVRPRPSVAFPDLDPLAVLPDHYSFPSGHACAAMAVALPIALVHPWSGSVALVAALAVGASRVYLRVHYPTDVMVGQAVGATAAVTAWLAFR